MFRAITLDNFPPFGKCRIDLPETPNKPENLAEVHLITGVNGTGKTRLLAAIAAFLGAEAEIKKRLVPGNPQIAATGSSKTPEGEWGRLSIGHGWNRAGHIYNWAQQVPAFAYNGAAYVSDAKIAIMAAVQQPDRAKCLAFSRPEKHSDALLQAISNLEMRAALEFMKGGDVNKTEQGYIRLVRTLENTLTDITGHPFSFVMEDQPQPSICVKWANVKMQFQQLPDGLRSIIGWLVDAVGMMHVWLQGKGDVMNTEAVFLLDELESHLHPVWQRRILPAFQKLFPKSQMFVSTHSPFVISSLNYGWIHMLTMETDGTVRVREPKQASLGDSYITAVEEIMGLNEWYDPETEGLLKDFREEREKAYSGNSGAREEALKIAEKIASRSNELRMVMGREISQMEKLLKRSQ